MPNYWLFKSEPDCYSIDDLKRDKTTFWDGVRNYQARNLLRDSIKTGDGVLFYHSSCEPMAIVGTAEVVKDGSPDKTAFDPKSDHPDPKSDPDNPTWYGVDIRFRDKFKKAVHREDIKGEKRLAKMVLLKRGSRLSVQPVTAEEWRAVLQIAGIQGT